MPYKKLAYRPAIKKFQTVATALTRQALLKTLPQPTVTRVNQQRPHLPPPLPARRGREILQVVRPSLNAASEVITYPTSGLRFRWLGFTCLLSASLPADICAFATVSGIGNLVFDSWEVDGGALHQCNGLAQGTSRQLVPAFIARAAIMFQLPERVLEGVDSINLGQTTTAATLTVTEPLVFWISIVP